MTQEIKRLYRSRTETRIAGLCGGMGVYFQVDPVIVRLVCVLGTVATGFAPGIITYLVAWLIVPEEPAPAPAAAPAADVQPNEGQS
jgi:phage shock protein PspC (stress-responsive transcriptional regulator)